VYEFRAEFYRGVGTGIKFREHSAADAVASFENGDSESCLAKVDGSGKTCGTRADNEDFFRHRNH
jgi:hypothetical protein